MLAAIVEMAEEAAKGAATPLWSLADAEVVDCLRMVHRCEQTLAVWKARLVREAASRDVPAAQGHRSLPGWLRSTLLLDPAPARELAERAKQWHRLPRLEEALIGGEVDARQASAIADAVEAIPAALRDIDPDLPPCDAVGQDQEDAAGRSGGPLTDQALSALLEMAGRFPAYQLRRLGERILAHVAPEVADRAEEAALLRAEARARRKRHFTLSLPVDGVVRVSGLLPVEDAAIVRAAIAPLCTPIPGDDRTPGQRRADALVEVCRLALRTTDLPQHGGEPPQVAVTVPLDALTGALGTGRLDTGDSLSPATARRMACDARILPLVLGGAGQVLDAGRARRLATGALRRALVARDRGCTFPGCDRPPRWCDGHHLQPWSQGGPTNLDNLALLCRHHHVLIHDAAGGWQVRLGPDGLPDFIPPPWTDPAQRPRRNLYHRRT